MFKSCSKCGKIHDTKYKCIVGRTYTQTDERKLRSKYSWTLKSEEIRERANHLCEVCRDQGIYNYNDLEVHHIKKLREDCGGLLDNYNLICLCQEHHKQADAHTLGDDYLYELARKREQG